MCYSDPESHPFIKDSEREYLQNSLGRLERDKNLPPTPWLKIITNVPMLALICAQIGHDWGFYVMVSDLPKYMNDVLRFPVKSNGLYSTMPFLAMWIVSVSTGVLGDWLIKSNTISITNSRKMFTTIGKIFLFSNQNLRSNFKTFISASFFPAFFIVFASYAECNRVWVVIWFILAMGFMGTFYPGMKVNPLDLSPNYAGTLMAITNGIGALTGVAAPSLVGEIAKNVSLICKI